MTAHINPAPGKHGPIEVFRAGSFVDMGGGRQNISEADLHGIAKAYDRELHPALVVLGHPETDAPAWGWVENLYVEGGVLKATLEETAPEFVDLVKAGRYKKVSITAFSPHSANNPKPGTLYLKHIGFLGAVTPAVPGPKPVKFSDAPGDCILMYQENAAAAHFAELDELARLRRQVREQEVERLVEEGRVLPVFCKEVTAFAASLDDRETISFAEGQETTRKDWFMRYLARQPKVVSFGEMDLGPDPFDLGDTRPGRQDSFIPDGYQVDPANAALFVTASRIARERSISFAEAVDVALSTKV